MKVIAGACLLTPMPEISELGFSTHGEVVQLRPAVWELIALISDKMEAIAQAEVKLVFIEVKVAVMGTFKYWRKLKQGKNMDVVCPRSVQTRG